MATEKDLFFAKIKAQLTKTMQEYRCCGGLQLVDVLTPEGSKDIGPGKEEMASLIDDLTWDLGNLLYED